MAWRYVAAALVLALAFAPDTQAQRIGRGKVRVHQGGKLVAECSEFNFVANILVTKRGTVCDVVLGPEVTILGGEIGDTGDEFSDPTVSFDNRRIDLSLCNEVNYLEFPSLTEGWLLFSPNSLKRGKRYEAAVYGSFEEVPYFRIFFDGLNWTQFQKSLPKIAILPFLIPTEKHPIAFLLILM